MFKSYAQLTHEIERLEQQAEDLRSQELAGVVTRIREAIATYGLTANDLGFAGSVATKVIPLAGPAPKLARRGKSPQAGTKVPAKYRDDAGNEWTGRGMTPRWINAALAAGATLESFLIAGAASLNKSAVGKVSNATVSKPANPKSKSNQSNGKAKFKDGAGNTWSGRGPMPGWLKAAVANGKTLAQMAA
jgi:DNA-binding protein H-NS